MLVLIALQKLASSSVAAVRRAIRRRLERLVTDRREPRPGTDESASLIQDYLELEAAGETDELNRREEDLTERLLVRLMRDEEPRLRELLAAADAVTEETKVARLLSLLETSFAGRSVLLFTEYKATQSLVMSALIRRFGEGCVAFINGDDQADDVVDATGQLRTFYDTKDGAAEKFNAGTVRFLVSTEAGGEGIDLHERCYSLVNVDLPWNPMRLHQRVGRLNRYGQRRQVEVVNLHNPDTVESLIWEKLNDKITSIMNALARAMDEPEDLLQLVLGMTSPSLFRDIFSEAPAVPRESLADWFDQKTARFGGRDVLETVQELVGHANRFDFAQVAPDLPKLDLPALAPFLKAMLALNGRQVREEAGTLAFKTPEAWAKAPGVRPEYLGLTFDRQDRSPHAAQRVLGVGHPVVDQALAQARASTACVAALPTQALKRPLLLFTIADRLTTEGGTVRQAVVGVDWPDRAGESPSVLRDWELLLRLNKLLERRGLRRLKDSAPPEDIAAVKTALEQAQRFLEATLPTLRLPFEVPVVAALAVLWPTRSGSASAESSGPDERDDAPA